MGGQERSIGVGRVCVGWIVGSSKESGLYPMDWWFSNVFISFLSMSHSVSSCTGILSKN